MIKLSLRTQSNKSTYILREKIEKLNYQNYVIPKKLVYIKHTCYTGWYIDTLRRTHTRQRDNTQPTEMVIERYNIRERLYVTGTEIQKTNALPMNVARMSL